MAFALFSPRPNSHPFQERHIVLNENVKIGRAVAKTKPSNNNGIFDCKVLSRNHALLWYENGKFMLQDTKSSNGTYVNTVRLSRNSEESEPCEIKSNDILQFGVEVVENSKNVTHGCIIGLITLFHEDGTEATGTYEETSSGILSILTADKSIQPHELWQLSQFLQDALHREQMLENKLASLQRIISESQHATDETFQGFVKEDKLLSRLETLENQLEIVSKEAPEDENGFRKELVAYQDQRLQYETSAKEALQSVLDEKCEALRKLTDAERMLSDSEDELAHLKLIYDKSQDELHTLMDTHRQRIDELTELKVSVESAKEKSEEQIRKLESEKEGLKSDLEDAEKRGSTFAVQVESLQAECDFTKQQLSSIKDKLQSALEENGRLKTEREEQEEKETQKVEGSEKSIPFASEHATLEKDVQNKSAYIQTLKAELAQAYTDLENSKKKQTDEWSNSLKKINNKLAETKNHLQKLDTSISTFSSTEDKETSSSHFDVSLTSPGGENPSIDTLNENLSNLNKAILAMNVRVEGTAKANKKSREENKEEIENKLESAYLEMEEVRKQIVVLGDRLLKEQENNKQSKKIATELESKLADSKAREEELVTNYENVIHQLYEAHKQMNADHLEQSRSYESVETARRLAKNMQAKACGYQEFEDSIEEDNSKKEEKLRESIQQDDVVQQTIISTRKRHESVYQDSNIEDEPSLEASESNEQVVREDDRSENEHQVIEDEPSLEASESNEQVAREDDRSENEHQVTWVALCLYLLIVMFGALVMLGILRVNYGHLPLLDHRNWSEALDHILEQLF